MMSPTTRKNLVHLLRSTLLVNANHAATIVDRSYSVVSGPIHDAVLVVDRFDHDGSGSFQIDVGDVGVGGGVLRKGDLDRWFASPAGIAAIAKRDAEDAAYEASIHFANVVALRVSDRFAGTAELETDDGRILPMIPVNDEVGQDLVDLHDDLVPGTAVRMRILPAAEMIDDFARTLPGDQPCVDFVMRALAA
jgi:hypothetical protein